MATDPVCGMSVEPTSAAAQAEFDGQTYYFCALGCRAAFIAAPMHHLHPATVKGMPEPGPGLVSLGLAKRPALGLPVLGAAPAHAEALPEPPRVAPPSPQPTLAAATHAASQPRTASPVTEPSAGPAESWLFQISGMTCASCATRVEAALRGVGGVISARVNLATGKAFVVGALPPGRVVEAVLRAGYGAVPQARDESPIDVVPIDAHAGSGSRFLVSALFTLPLLVLAMGFMHHRGRWMELVELLLCVPVMFIGARPFFSTATRLLRHGSVNMDTLVALGAGAAFVYSVVVYYWRPGTPLYFESAATIVTLILLGRWLEDRARRRAGAALRALAALQPTTAHLLTHGCVEDVQVATLLPGDRCLVRPGERFPADGVVLRGESDVDEAALTGEPLPRSVGVGDTVIGAAINHDGVLEVELHKTGRDTAFAQVLRLVAEAQGSKAPAQRLADRVSAVFVPAILLIALLTGCAYALRGVDVGLALVRAVSVLVVACPCALGLATPIALMVSLGRAAALGVLVRDAESLERAGALKVIAFDKTGTLTRAMPQVSSAMRTAHSTLRDAELWAMIGALEAQSEHPLARALADHAALEGPSTTARPSAAVVTRGGGISATLEGRTLVLGSARFVRSAGVAFDDDATTALATFDGAADTVVCVAVNGGLEAIIGLRDTLRPEAKAAVDALRRLDVVPVLLTGDRGAAATRIGEAVGIADIVADALPAEKVAALHARRGAGRTVGMVGDGINDAPALAAADVGFAVGHGSDLAKEAAAIVLLRSDLRAVAATIVLSRATRRVIRQNLAWAFGYNALLVPLAAAGLLDPMLSAAAMAFSSVSVVLNSLRLRNVKLGADAEQAGG